MHRKEVEERGLTVEDNGHILDQFGNEHRDEDGHACWLEDNCEWCKKLFSPSESGHDNFCSDYCKLEEYNNS